MDYNKKSNKHIPHPSPRITKERSLKLNNYNPSKDSPNLFMTKLQMRLRQYQSEQSMLNDPFAL